MIKTALSIAGSDCSGGAGIQADIKTMSALGVFGMSVIVSVVAENTSRVVSISDVPPQIIADQIDAVFEDIRVDAVKVGMLSTPECMETVASKIRQYAPRHVVIDPVMYAKNGCPLMREESIGTLISTVIPQATLLTPNIPEARVLTGLEIDDVAAMVRAGRALLARGCRAALVKGGHLDQRLLTDVLVMHDRPSRLFITGKVDSHNLHGTGCTLSSALADYMARGERLEKAVESAETYVKKAIFAGSDVRVGHGNGPLCHAFAPEAMHKSNI